MAKVVKKVSHAGLQAMAKERGQTPVEGDVLKWLGHAHNKMGEPKRAEELFSEGEMHCTV